MISLLLQIGTEENWDGLLAGLLLLVFLILILPPLAATVTGIASGLTMTGGKAWWGGAVGLGLGAVGAIINVAGLYFLPGSWNIDPWGWALEIFCPQDRNWYELDRDSTCIRALDWADKVFWGGISLITPAAAAAGTWWLCRRRSIGLGVKKLRA